MPQTIADVVIMHVVLFAVCFLFLVFVNQTTKAAPLPSSAALPATEAYHAPKSASPLVGSCRLHPFIEGKLPLSPKAVEPSYEAWVPQGPPQRPGYGLLIPKSQPRPRRQPVVKPLVARARVLVLAPLKPSVAGKAEQEKLKKLKKQAEDRVRMPPPSIPAAGPSTSKQTPADTTAALQQQQQPQPQQQQQPQHFAAPYQPPRTNLPGTHCWR